MPDLSGATRESKLLGKLKLLLNVSRPAARPGLAFFGDAALASDPLWGVGCGWALQTAEWLSDEVAPAIHGGDLDAALERYRRLHRRRLGPHHFLIADLATARPANPFARALPRLHAGRDGAARLRGRGQPPPLAGDMLDPRVLIRLVRSGRRPQSLVPLAQADVATERPATGARA